MAPEPVVDPVVTGTPAEAAAALAAEAVAAATPRAADGTFVSPEAAAVPEAQSQPIAPVAPPIEVRKLDGIGDVPVPQLEQVYRAYVTGQWDLHAREAEFQEKQREMSAAQQMAERQSAQTAAEAKALMDQANAMLYMAQTDPEGFQRLATSPAVRQQMAGLNQMGQPRAPVADGERPLTPKDLENFKTEMAQQGQRFRFENEIVAEVHSSVNEETYGAFAQHVKRELGRTFTDMLDKRALPIGAPKEQIKYLISEMAKPWREAVAAERQRAGHAREQRQTLANTLKPPLAGATPTPTPQKDTRPLHKIPAKEFVQTQIMPLTRAAEPRV